MDGTWFSALVGEHGAGRDRDEVYGRAARQQGVRERIAAVVCKRAQHGVTRVVRVAAAVPNPVAPIQADDTSASWGRRLREGTLSARAMVVGNDRVLDIEPVPDDDARALAFGGVLADGAVENSYDAAG